MVLYGEKRFLPVQLNNIHGDSETKRKTFLFPSVPPSLCGKKIAGNFEPQNKER